MTQITLQLPEAFADLPAEEQDSLIRASLYEASRARVRHLERELAEAQEQLRIFEAHYKMSLADFERHYLPNADSFQEHDVYNDWAFWQSVAHEKEKLLVRYQALLAS